MGAVLSRGHIHLLQNFCRRIVRRVLSMSSLAYVLGIHSQDISRVWVPFPGRKGLLASFIRIAAASTIISFRVLKLLFVPDVMLRQLLVVSVLHATYELYTWFFRGRHVMMESQSIRRMKKQLAESESYEVWRRRASVLDSMEGNYNWKQNPESENYCHESVRRRITHYKRMIAESDVTGLMFHLRSDLMRKHYGISSASNYLCRVGTKHIIEEYLDVVDRGLLSICDAPVNAETARAELANRLAFFNETRHSFGRSALLLSGGASLGLYHSGVVRAMVEHQLLPRVISGASAGSIVAGVIATKTDEELLKALVPGGLDLQFFGVDPSLPSNSLWHRLLVALPAPLGPILGNLLRWATTHTILDIEFLGRSVRKNVGDFTFQEAYDRTGRILNITVTPASGGAFPRLLNYLTAPHVLVWSAVVASCAVPGVFRPVELLARDDLGNIVPYMPEGLTWNDGSLEWDLPIGRLSELFDVNHFIVSQVNPHGRFLVSEVSGGSGWLPKLIYYFKSQVKGYIADMAQLELTSPLRPLGLTLVPILTQKYHGDITIVPRWPISDLLILLNNPSLERLAFALQTGQRATWPHLDRIRTACRTEFSLDNCVNKVRARLASLETDVGHEVLGRVSRVPSFHTSPSLLNVQDLDGSAAAATAEDEAVAAAAAAAAAVTGVDSRSDRAAAAPMVRRRAPSFHSSPSLLNVMDLDAGAPGVGIAMLPQTPPMRYKDAPPLPPDAALPPLGVAAWPPGDCPFRSTGGVRGSLARPSSWASADGEASMGGGGGGSVAEHKMAHQQS